MRKGMLAGMMLAALVCAVAHTAGPAAGGGPVGIEGAPAALKPFAFLIGEWPAAGAGQPGAGSGVATFTPGMQGKVIVRSSYAEYPAAAGKPASRHDDLMVIYAAPEGGARADYYDSEGHVIRYAALSPAAGQAIFLSDAVGGAPRFRLSYTLAAPGVLKGEFAIAPPGSPEAFKPYLAWESRNKGEIGR